MSPPVLGKRTSVDPMKSLVTINVVLPSGRDILMTVKRSTPMMDLLVQIATANKISPGSHVIHATSVSGAVPYKPSTPVGDLGSCILNIVPKNQISSTNTQKLKLVNAPFEQTFRLQVFLPRNQLYVTRISPKIKIADILTHVCSEKNLDPSKYSIRHPNNLGEVLDTNLCLADYKLTQVALVWNPSRSVSMSSINVTELNSPNRQINYNRAQSLNANFKNDSETSSSEKSSHPAVIPVRPPKKRRPAPKPPQASNQNAGQTDLSGGDSETTVISHSRNSSDSSGYHETSVLGESPEIDYCFSEPLSHRNKLSSCPEMSQYENLPSLSRSLSNLTAVGSNLSKAMSIISHSVSTTCLPSATRRKKKAPSPPPKFMLKSNTINEETSSSCSRPETESISSLCASSIPSDSEPSTPVGGMHSDAQDCLNVGDPHEAKAATLPANTKLPEIECVPQEAEEEFLDAEGPGQEEEEQNVDGSTKSAHSSDPSQSEIKMNDEEIDRIFRSATDGHESCANTPLSSLETTSPRPDDTINERLSSPASNTTAEIHFQNHPPSSQGKISTASSCLETLSESDQQLADSDEFQQRGKNKMSQKQSQHSDESFRSRKCEAVQEETSKSGPSLNVCSNSFSRFADSLLENSESKPKESLSVTSKNTSPTVPSQTNSVSAKINPSSTLNSTAPKAAEKLVTNKNPSSENSLQINANPAVFKTVEKQPITNGKVVSKSPVMKELKAAINDQTFKTKKAAPFKQPELKRSNSVLDNFKISAYHTIKKPIHILSDSLESSSFNDPYKDSNVKKSLSIIYDQSAIFGRPLKPVQRSTSHVSLSTIETRNDLAFKSNLPTFKNLKSKVVSNGNLAASNENILKYCSTSNLRKISSEMSLNEEKNVSGLASWKSYSPFKNRCDLEADSGLQSLQVMKTILPKLHRSCSNLSESKETEPNLPESQTWENSESNTFKVPYPVTKVTKLSSPKFVDPPPSRLRSPLGKTSPKSLFSRSTQRLGLSNVEDSTPEEEEVSRIPTVKSVELKKNAFGTFSMPPAVPDYSLVSLSSYNRFERPSNVNRYSSPCEQVNGVNPAPAEFQEPIRPAYPFERSFSKENSTFSENHLKDSLKSSQLKSVILNDGKSVRDLRVGQEKSPVECKRELRELTRDASASKKFVGVPSPPPAFVMPKLKPASQRQIKSPKSDADPKGMLLDSIRSFGGISNLRKTGNVI